MKESYSEDIASHTGLELYADGGNVVGVATTEVHAGELLSSEITLFVRRPCLCSGKTICSVAFWQGTEWHGGVVEPQHAWKLQAREPGDPRHFPRNTCSLGTVGKRLRRHSRHAREWGVRWLHSTNEASEQSRNVGGGVCGGKGVTEGKYCRIVADVPNSELDPTSISAALAVTTRSNA